MESIISIYKNKALWPATIAIIALFATVPHLIFNYSYPLCVIVVSVGLYLYYNKLAGFSIVIFAYSLMLPFGDYKAGTGASNYIPYLYTCLLLIVAAVVKNTKVSYEFKMAIPLLVVLFLISVSFMIINQSVNEIRLIFFFAISTFGAYRLAFLDSVSLKSFLQILDIIFYATAFYVVQEIIFQMSPYQFIYKEFPLDFQLRAKGLMGHPLLLSSFLTFYHASILIRGIIYKKINLLNLIIVLGLVVLSASKTVLILVVVAWLFYIVVSKSFIKPKFYVGAAIFALIAIQLYPYFEKSVLRSADRILNSNANHRLGSYSVAFQVFESNPLGIGIGKDALRNEIHRASYTLNANYDSDFLIFDNAYLTALCAYGILGLAIFLPYIEPVRSLRVRKRKVTKKFQFSMLLLFAMWALQNISFDSFFYFPVNSFYFVFSALLVKASMQALVNQTVGSQPINEGRKVHGYATPN